LIRLPIRQPRRAEVNRSTVPRRVIDGALRSRTDERRAAEVAVAVSVLNPMLELGRQMCVRMS
jgi:hypothetical protein